MGLNAIRYSILKEDRGESKMRMLTSKFKSLLKDLKIVLTETDLGTLLDYL